MDETNIILIDWLCMRLSDCANKVLGAWLTKADATPPTQRRTKMVADSADMTIRMILISLDLRFRGGLLA
jgi:hypothetical protein